MGGNFVTTPAGVAKSQIGVLSGMLSHMLILQERNQSNHEQLLTLRQRVYLPGRMSLEMFSLLDEELGATEGQFNQNYSILFPGISVCYQDFKTAEYQIGRKHSAAIQKPQAPGEQSFEVILQIELDDGQSSHFVEAMQITHNAKDQGVYFANRLHLEIMSLNVIDAADEQFDIFVIMCKLAARH